MTSRYVYGDDARLIAWAETRIADFGARSDACAIGHERDGALAAVMVFDTFSATGCMVHIASDGRGNWMTREFAARCMAFPFLQCGFPRIGSLISERNEASLRFARRTGWVEEGRLRRAGSQGEDYLLFGMLREECRWIRRGP